LTVIVALFFIIGETIINRMIQYIQINE